MRIVNLKRVQPGDILGKSIFNEKGGLLLAAGYTLTEDMIGKIKSKGYYSVYIMDDLSEGINPEEVVTESVHQIVSQKMAETFENIKENMAFENFAPEKIKKMLNEDPKMQNLVKMPSIRQQVNSLIEDIIEHNVIMFTSLPIKSDSGKDHQHALDTAILSILVAQNLNYSRREMRLIGAAALVHDVGKMIFPKIKDLPYSDLTREERMLLREHPTYSMQILAGSDENTFVEQTAVLQHHELANGRGYPQGLKSCHRSPNPLRTDDSGFIYRYAEILSITNAYDNLISGARDGQKYTPSRAVAVLVDESNKGMWNRYALKALTNVIQAYPVGATVKIKFTSGHRINGYVGIIKSANPVDQSKPVVVITHNSVGAPILPREVDLSSEKVSVIELMI